MPGLSACGGGTASVFKPLAPNIITQPSSQSVFVGQMASFSVIADGNEPLRYQWQRDGIDEAGAIGAIYSLAAVRFADDNSVWTVRISNASGSVTSAAARLNVKPVQTGNISLLVSDLKLFENDLAVDGAGNVFVSGYSTPFDLTSNLQKITSAGVSTTLTTGLVYPTGIAVDAVGNVYVADNVLQLSSCSPWHCRDNYAAIVRKISPSGIMTILAGSATNGDGVDGAGAAASFNIISSLAIDSSGNVYVGEYYDERIRKITPGGVVTTLVKGLPLVWSLAADSAGNVYASSILPPAGGQQHGGVVSKISSTGIVTTLAGNLNESGSNDGSGTVARFDSAFGIAVDRSGNVYVADSNNNSIRKISPEGMVSTVTGQSENAIILGPLPGNIPHPKALAFDTQGALYVTSQSGAIFKIQFSN